MAKIYSKFKVAMQCIHSYNLFIFPYFLGQYVQNYNDAELVYACRNKNITLNCFGKSKNQSKFVWTFNGSGIENAGRTKSSILIATTGNHSRAVIQNATGQEAGLYACTERSSSGDAALEKRFNVLYGKIYCACTVKVLFSLSSIQLCITSSIQLCFKMFYSALFKGAVNFNTGYQGGGFRTGV